MRLSIEPAEASSDVVCTEIVNLTVSSDSSQSATETQRTSEN